MVPVICIGKHLLHRILLEQEVKHSHAGGLGYQPGDTVRAATTAAVNVGYCGYMEGNVTAYNSVSGVLTMNVVRS